MLCTELIGHFVHKQMQICSKPLARIIVTERMPLEEHIDLSFYVKERTLIVTTLISNPSRGNAVQFSGSSKWARYKSEHRLIAKKVFGANETILWHNVRNGVSQVR